MLTHRDIVVYFKGEKQLSLVFIIVGVISIILSLVFYFGFNSQFFAGASIPFLLFGLIQLLVGAGVYRRSDGDIVRVKSMMDYQKSALKEIELPRMRQVNSNFKIFRFTEIILLLTGIGVYLWGRYHHPALTRSATDIFWQGLGAALALQSLILLIADYIAEGNAKIYTRHLKDFTENMSI